jgi:hypothetical protein
LAVLERDLAGLLVTRGSFSEDPGREVEVLDAMVEIKVQTQNRNVKALMYMTIGSETSADGQLSRNDDNDKR